MKIIVKKLQGGECALEVLPTTYVSEIKSLIAEKLGIPVEEQKLLLLGRTLADDHTVQSYPSIKDGIKLNVVVKKPEGLQEVATKCFKKLGMNDNDSTNSAIRLLIIVQEKFNKLSWDDIERLSIDCLADEGGLARPPAEVEPDCDDMFVL